jgi:hypothetical protein
MAPWLGGSLLAAMGGLAVGGALRREPVGCGLALYAVMALALIAVGRAAESGGIVHSRYYVLGAVAWAMMAFMALARYSHPERPMLILTSLVPVLALFNVNANRLFAERADTWVECRDRAALRFEQHGVDGRGAFKLHPAPAHATTLLQQAERSGVYRMGVVCIAEAIPREFEPSTRIQYFVDEITVSPRSAFIRGWAAIPGARSERGQIHLVLRSGDQMHLYTTVTATRPDVAEAMKQPGWVLSGFRFARPRERLPTGEFQIGFLIEHEGTRELIMTAHRVILVGEGKALLATGD